MSGTFGNLQALTELEGAAEAVSAEVGSEGITTEAWTERILDRLDQRKAMDFLRVTLPDWIEAHAARQQEELLDAIQRH